jgi:peptidoglycan/xylan/chitin deacetylase (PgdA/CDA1 family)
MTGRLVKLMVSMVVALSDCILAQLPMRFGSAARSRCVVIYYHAIRATMRSRFARQMDMLARHSTPIDIARCDRVPPGRRYSAVTFDDGFVSVIENALPELRARSIPCVIFVPSAALGAHPKWIRAQHRDAVEQVMDSRMLAEVSHDPLVSIGSHSMTHPNFSRIDNEEARRQLSNSKALLEAITGRQVSGFSFPHGAYTPTSLLLAQECGYTRIYTIEPRIVNPGAGTLIGRVKVEPHDWPIEFRLKLMGAYRWMVHVTALKRSLRSALGLVRPVMSEGV